jgi:hypothetical protein
MRHLVGLILGLATAAAVFFGGGWGVARVVAAHQHGASLVSVSGGLDLAALLGTGLLLGILIAVQWLSPLGAGLPGLVMLGWSALDVFSAHWALRLIPLSQLGASSGFRVLLTGGMLALLGAVMIVPLFVPSRWRRREPADEFAERPSAQLVH